MIYVMLANGFEETELIVPTDILRRGGVQVQLVGIQGRQATSGRGITLHADIQIDDLLPYELEMLILPGGQPGVDNLWADERVRNLVEHTAAANKYLGAICAAPMIPGRLGILDGRRAVCYPGCEKELRGAQLVQDAGVVRDGTVITARGAGAAFSFGLALLEAVTGKEQADSVASSMQFKR